MIAIIIKISNGVIFFSMLFIQLAGNGLVKLRFNAV
jgi:hypothetical protein